ncbi:MAG: ATP-dependent RNA helicase, partial [Steroidobacteraceae bacterium]
AGRAFPVETRYAGRGAPPLPFAAAPQARGDSAERATAQLVQRALRDAPGDVLVFLPGAAEIRRVQSLLADALRAAASLGPVRVLPLYGDLAAAEQDAALAPGAADQRKVILSTNIAETSLTVEGIRIVVDSGLVRRSQFDPVTGMSRLETRRISRASADQRRGRAGRLEAGVCYRAWSEEAHRSLAPFSAPEIVEADLAPLALELAAWGVLRAEVRGSRGASVPGGRDALEPESESESAPGVPGASGGLRWLDAPPAAMLASARDLLARLGAIDRADRITPHGREMAALAVHPRLAHMLLEARRSGEVQQAVRLAALLSERDVLLRGAAMPGGASRGAADADVRSRLERLEQPGRSAGETAAMQRVERTARALARQLTPARQTEDRGPRPARGAEGIGVLLACAYPDRIGRRRSGVEGRYLLANGRGASFTTAQSLARQELIVAVDLDDRDREARILLAAPLDRAQIEARFADRLATSRSIEWSAREQAVVARETTKLDALVLDEKPLQDAPPEAARRAMLDGVRQMGLDALPWSRDLLELRARVGLVRGLDEPVHARRGGEPREWPDMRDESLIATLESWLAPWLDGVTRREHLAGVRLGDALLALLSWERRQRLDALAPTHLLVPSGSRVRIDYLDESAPVVSVRLQEVFGLGETPRLAGGRIPVTFKLLSPAQRPVQITRDLASFWRGGYAEVRKDLRGRYPRHYWPENPLEAQATHRVRPRT